MGQRNPPVIAPATQDKLSEAQFQSQVTDLATRFGWKWHHEHYSVGSKPGFPDLCLVHPVSGILFLELKARNNRPTSRQRDWIHALRDAGIPAYVFWPWDLEVVARVLAGDLPIPDDELEPRWAAMD